MTALAIRDSKIGRLQEIMMQMPQFDGCKTEHQFADGMYARSVWAPANTTIIGRLHKTEHFFLLLSGEMTIASDTSSERFRAPTMFVSPPGTKRAIYTHTDVVFMNIHRLSNPEQRNMDDIEKELVDDENDVPSAFDFHNQPKTPELKGPAPRAALE